MLYKLELLAKQSNISSMSSALIRVFDQSLGENETRSKSLILSRASVKNTGKELRKKPAERWKAGLITLAHFCPTRHRLRADFTVGCSQAAKFI